MTNNQIIDLMIYPIKKFIALLAQLTLSSGTLLGYLVIGLILVLISSFIFRSVNHFDEWADKQGEKEEREAKKKKHGT